MIRELCKAGKRHENDAAKCQDTVVFKETDQYYVLTVTDGVSSCRSAKKGAETAGRCITDLLASNAEVFQILDENKIADLVLEHVVYELKAVALNNGEEIEDYSSTVTSVLYNKANRKTIVINLGDSLVLSTHDNEYNIISYPYNSNNGCPVTTSKNAKKYMNVEVFDSFDMDSVMILSDGAWRILFDSNEIKKEVRTMITEMNYDDLDEYLIALNSFDDYSYAALKIVE